MSKPKKLSVEELQQQIGELTEALQRERADSMNLRRRTEAERAQLADFYKSMVVRQLLPAIDNLERALKHAPVSKDGPWKQWHRGVDGVGKQFDECLEKLGVERIKTVGEKFDPGLHEAISAEDTGGQVEIVCEEVQPGYRIGDEIIRHAMVKVRMEQE